VNTLAGSRKTVSYYGGGPIATIGDDKLALNVSVLNYGANVGHRRGYALIPNIGVSVAVSEHVKFNLDTFSFNAPNSDYYGKAWAVAYAIRFFSGEGRFFGDVGFVAPIYARAGRFYKWAPMGIPIIALGYAF
jgi:hypothetical protein